MKILKVAASTKALELAKAIVTSVRKEGIVEVQTIGTASLNQAVQAISIAQKLTDKSELVCTPRFLDLEVSKKGKKAFSLYVRKENAK